MRFIVANNENYYFAPEVLKFKETNCSLISIFIAIAIAIKGFICACCLTEALSTKCNSKTHVLCSGIWDMLSLQLALRRV